MNLYLRVSYSVEPVIALMLVLMLFPLLVILSIGVWISMGRPVLFKQKRVGYQEKIFMFYKFRSMNDDVDDLGKLLPDMQRMTHFGRFLRKSSLDELPQLLNIIKGEMSFVGPRPLLVDYLTRYNSEQRKRHHVKPGVTGLAQVNGRNAISWEEKFRFDVLYINKVSLIMDAAIVFKTVFKVFFSRGVNASDDDTMKVFEGS